MLNVQGAREASDAFKSVQLGARGLSSQLKGLAGTVTGLERALHAIKGAALAGGLAAFGREVARQDKLLYDLSRTARITGESFEDMKASMEDVSKATTHSRQEIALFFRQIQMGTRGMKPSAAETANLAKILTEEFGPSIEEVTDALKDLQAIQQKEIFVLRNLNAGMDPKQAVAYASALALTGKASEKEIQTFMRAAQARDGSGKQWTEEERKMREFRDSVQALQKTFQDLLLDIGTPMTKALTDVAKGADHILKKFSQLIQQGPSLKKALAFAPYATAGLGVAGLAAGGLRTLGGGGLGGHGAGGGGGGGVGFASVLGGKMKNYMAAKAFAASEASDLKASGMPAAAIAALKGSAFKSEYAMLNKQGPSFGGVLGNRALRGGGMAKMLGGGAMAAGGSVLGSALTGAGHEGAGHAVSAASNIFGGASMGAGLGSMIAPGIGTAIGGVLGGLGGAAGSAKDLSALMEPLKEAMASVFGDKKGLEYFESLKDTLAKIGEVVQPLIDAGKELATTVFATLLKTLDALKRPLIALIDLSTKLSTSALKLLTGALEILGNVLVKGIQVVTPIIEVLSAVLGKLADAIGYAIDKLREGLSYLGLTSKPGETLKGAQNYAKSKGAALASSGIAAGLPGAPGAAGAAGAGTGGGASAPGAGTPGGSGGGWAGASQVTALIQAKNQVELIQQQVAAISQHNDQIAQSQLMINGNIAGATKLYQNNVKLRQDEVAELRKAEQLYKNMTGGVDAITKRIADYEAQLSQAGADHDKIQGFISQERTNLDALLGIQSKISTSAMAARQEYEKINQALQVQTDLSGQQVSLVESELALMNSLYLGMGPTLDKQMEIVGAIEQQIAAMDQQISLQKQILAGNPNDLMAKKQSLELQTKRNQLVQKELDITKNLRDGYLNAISAFTNVEGAFGKIILNQEQGIGEMMRQFGAPGSIKAGALGAGANDPLMRLKQGGGMEFIGADAFNANAKKYDKNVPPLMIPGSAAFGHEAQQSMINSQLAKGGGGIATFKPSGQAAPSAIGKELQDPMTAAINNSIIKDLVGELKGAPGTGGAPGTRGPSGAPMAKPGGAAFTDYSERKANKPEDDYQKFIQERRKAVEEEYRRKKKPIGKAEENAPTVAGPLDPLNMTPEQRQAEAARLGKNAEGRVNSWVNAMNTNSPDALMAGMNTTRGGLGARGAGRGRGQGGGEINRGPGVLKDDFGAVAGAVARAYKKSNANQYGSKDAYLDRQEAKARQEYKSMTERGGSAQALTTETDAFDEQYGISSKKVTGSRQLTEDDYAASARKKAGDNYDVEAQKVAKKQLEEQQKGNKTAQEQKKVIENQSKDIKATADAAQSNYGESAVVTPIGGGGNAGGGGAGRVIGSNTNMSDLTAALFGMADGGKIPGYGGGDRRPAMLEDGEFVLRKEAVKALGVRRLESMNMAKFAAGGPVGSVIPSPSVAMSGGGFAPKIALNVRGDTVKGIMSNVHSQLTGVLNDMVAPHGTSGRMWDLTHSG